MHLSLKIRVTLAAGRSLRKSRLIQGEAVVTPATALELRAYVGTQSHALGRR
jgi:plasmid maintenance system antidote protein VapI